MIPNFKVRLSVGNFTIKPTALKPKRKSNSHKHLTRLLYCIAKNTDEGWRAYINTRGLEGFEDTTILEFTEKSFDLRGRKEVFLKHKDKTNHWVRIIRSHDTDISPGSSEAFISLCDGDCFSGYIVKHDGVMLFDMKCYKGIASECSYLLTRNNKSKNNDDEE